LAKEVLGPLRSTSILEEGEGPEDFFLIASKLLQGQAQIQYVGVEKSSSRAPFAREVWGRREFWPRPLFGQSGWNQERRSSRRRRYCKGDWGTRLQENPQ